MPDTLGHAVGAERFELLARLAGNEVSCTILNYNNGCGVICTSLVHELLLKFWVETPGCHL